MVHDQQALLGGVRIHYRDWDGPSPDAPVAVLLHGYTGHSRFWDHVAEPLSARYRVLVPDARGHGESAWVPGTYDVGHQAADVAALLRALAVTSAAVVGLSMGGRTAYNLAALHPDLVERLVVVDIGPEIEAAGAARIGASAGAPDEFASFDEAWDVARAQSPLADEDVLRHRIRHALLLRDDGRWTWRYDADLRAPGRSTLPRPDAAEQWAVLSRVTAPTLVVRGSLSDVLSPATAEPMVATIPKAELATVEGSGHTVPMDRPAGFLAAIHDFLLGPDWTPYRGESRRRRPPLDGARLRPAG